MVDRGESASSQLRADTGTRNVSTRRHNLSAVLTHLHHSGPLTRAELTRRTGLNRSTIGALIAELSEHHLVHETLDAARAGVGRPSPLVHPNPKVCALSVNPDVDAIIVGLVGLGGVVHRRLRYALKAPPTAARTVKVVCQLVEQLRAGARDCRVVGLGVAVPGLVHAPSGVVTLAPHLGWHDEPLAAELAQATGYATFAGNDAKLGLIAETLFGAGQGVSDLIYLNGSTSGIGAGVLCGGRPLWGARGFAAELGHTLINSNGSACGCGRRGCLETEVSLGRLLSVIGQGSLDADQLELTLLGANDRALKAEMRRQVDWLGQAIAGFVSVFNPELVLLGGFLAALYRALPERLRERLVQSSLSPLAQGLRIERARLGSDLLLVGAAELALQPLLASPVGAEA
jgi:predicted NBD/HSP70 family sugar kinase